MKIYTLVIALLLTSMLSAEPASRPSLLPVGTVAPDFTARSPVHNPVKLSDYRGQVVLVDFWATWCGPCKQAMPHMEKLHQKLASQGLIVLGVCVWDSPKKFAEWLETPEVPTTYLKVFDPAGSHLNNIAKALYNVSGIPTFYLIDKEGKVAFSGVGTDRKVQAALDKALVAARFKL